MWFRRFIVNHLENADSRNAVAGIGITLTDAVTGLAPTQKNPVLISTSGPLSNIPDQTVLGNDSGAPAAPVALTSAQFTSMIGLFTPVLKGLVGASGGGTVNFLRADNSFTTVPVSSITPIAADTIVGNAIGGVAAPTALSQTQLTALVNLATASLSGAIPALSGVATQFFNGVGAFSTPASVSGANPTALVGLAAINGTATTFLRSDGAPALNVAIVPTWTGKHTFSVGAIVNGGAGTLGPGGENLTVSSTDTANGGIAVSTATADNLFISMVNTKNVATSFVELALQGGSSTDNISLTMFNPNTPIGGGFGGGIANLPAGESCWFGTMGSFPMNIGTNTANRLIISTTGTFTILKPTSGRALTVNGLAGGFNPTVVIQAPNTLNQSWGLEIIAGSSGSDVALQVVAADAATGLFSVIGNGAVTASLSPLAANRTQVATGVVANRIADATSASNALTADASLTLTFNEVGKYAIEIFLPFYEATVGTGGFQFDLGSGTATVGGVVFGVDGFVTGAVANAAVTSTTTATTAATVATSAAAPSWFLAKGWANITVAGTLAVRWAQNSALGADPTTLKAGAYFQAIKIG